jgi:hypothetical protein
VGSLLCVCFVIATKDTFENTGSDILSGASGLHAVVEGQVRFFEGIKSKLNLVGSTGNVVLWTIRILDGESVISLLAAIDTELGLFLLAMQASMKTGRARRLRLLHSDIGREGLPFQ